jgi:murein DD-endopeptidase MepM/ murein hydrolase activator NlpD
LRVSALPIEEAGLAKLVVLKKGGGGKVAINPDQVAYVRSAAGAFTDVFFAGQQVAVEGTFEDVVRLLSTPERRLSPEPGNREGQNGLAFAASPDTPDR